MSYKLSIYYILNNLRTPKIIISEIGLEEDSV